MQVAMGKREGAKPLLRRPTRIGTPLEECNHQGYEVVASMSLQLGDLEDICDVNAQEDMTRAKLASLLREQERVLSRLGHLGAIALDLNRRAQRALALIDVLDAAQGLDAKEPLKRAATRNREAHAAGRRIIACTEGGPAAPALAAVSA